MNYIANGTLITRNASSLDEGTTNSGTGAAFNGAAADSEVISTPTLDSSVHSGTTVQAGANFVNLAMADSDTDAEATSQVYGLVGKGAASAYAYSDGTLNAHVDGNVTAGTTGSDVFENLAVGFEKANTNAVAWSISFGTAATQSVAQTSPSVTAEMGSGASVTAAGSAYTMSITEDDATPASESKGIANPGMPDGALDMPRQTAMVGTSARLVANGYNVVEPFHNEDVVPEGFTVTALGPYAVANSGHQPPTINSAGTVLVAPNELSVITVTADEAQNNTLTYSIIGGANANLFQIVSTTGALSFTSEPSTDGPFTVRVEVADSIGGADWKDISVSIGTSSTLQPGAQRLADGSFQGTVSQSQVTSLAAIAEQIWQNTGLTPAQMTILNNLTYNVGTLPNGAIGSYQNGTINVSPDANQYGWFIDTSVTASNYASESAQLYTQTAQNTQTSFSAASGTNQVGGLDLLSLILHEQGHVLGLANSTNADDVMYSAISEGKRWLPARSEASGAVASTTTLYTDYDPSPAAETSGSLAGRGANYNYQVVDNNSGGLLVDDVDVNADASPDLNIVLAQARSSRRASATWCWASSQTTPPRRLAVG